MVMSNASGRRFGAGRAVLPSHRILRYSAALTWELLHSGCEEFEGGKTYLGPLSFRIEVRDDLRIELFRSLRDRRGVELGDVYCDV